MANIIKIDGVQLPETTDANRKRLVIETARKVFQLTGRAKLSLAACLYEIREEGYWSDYADSFDAFVYEEFGYKPSTADTLIRIYQTFVEHLEYDPETIADIPWARLAMILPLTNKENADNLLDQARDAATQRELLKYLKDMRGMHITESKEGTGAKFTFTVNEDQKEVVTEALKIAEELCGNLVHPGMAYEMICADFILNNQDNDSPEEHLSRSCRHLEKLHNVKITWESNGN